MPENRPDIAIYLRLLYGGGAERVMVNLMEALRFRKLWGSYFIPHWSQPGLIPRNPKRGDGFENIVFFGREQNLIHIN
ncbi:MAG: glycosyltransferase [Okeania sp. SIO2F4]|uniref:hypothetical protein n=1 Tax=Okeania sp. SIO2F4 TaxID=2607790 RepID=UPI00142B74CB|nr:hypothetical protein [Okeania sp. SIO2F4]NES04757.1 glycosyltransferase [Okeania sp. SIO2F4]